jgi:chromate reductase
LEKLDGFVFITFEYNRSVEAVLKNALDVGSLPYGKSVWDDKPGAIFSNSPRAVGGFGANHHLRQSLVFLKIPVMQQSEVYLAKINELFDESGTIKKEKQKNLLKKR